MSKSLRALVIAACVIAALPGAAFATNVDLSVFSVSGTPDPITLNTGDVTYTVQVFNASGTAGTNPVLTATLPVNGNYVSSSATGGGICSPSGGTVTCNWSSIPSSTNYFVTIVVTPTSGGSLTLSGSVAGTETDPNTANNTASKSVTVNAQIDLKVFSVSGTPDPITLNTGNVTYTVQVFNQSTSQGTGTVLTAPVPVNSTYVSSSATGGGTCSQSAGTVTCNWTSIPASNNYFATIVVTPTAGGALTLTATVAGTETDPNTADNSGSKSVTVNSQIDLRVFSVSGTPDPMTLNTGNVTYTVQVFNQSTSQGTGTVLTAPVPVNSTYVSSSATGGGTCSQSAGTVTCNWASIPASNNYFATIVVTPTAGGALTLTATVAGTETDPNTADNTGSKSVTVNSQIDLRVFNVSATPDPITLNTGNVTYTVQVFNQSTSQGTGTVLTAPVPVNSTYVSSSATGGGTCSQSAGTITCNWTSIPASNNYFVTIVVTPTAGGALTLTATVAGTEPDPNTADNTGSKSVTVNAQIDLQVFSVSGTPDPITFASGNEQFSVQLFNASSSQGTNPALTITLPSNSTFVSATATGGGTCSHTSGTATCNWTSIPASNNYFTTIIVTPTIPGTLTLSASVTGTEPDPNTVNNTGSHTTTVTPTSCTAVPSGAVAWYRAEGNGVDSVGPNFATANGGAAYTTGKAGQAFSLNGTTAYVSAPDNSSLRPTSLTLEAWVWFTSIPSTGVIVSKTVGSGANDSYLLWYQGGALHGVVGNTGGPGTIVDYTWTPTLNTWYHVAFTSDAAGNAETLYVNGALVSAATNTTAIGYDANPLLIGAEIESSATQYFFPGLIDELTIYNRALSQTEVQTVYGAGTFGKCFIAPSAPSISGFTPSSGNAGASIVISGANFTSVSGVKFNGTAATFAGDSTSQITATVPTAATAGTIAVTTSGGTATSGSSFTALTTAHWINSSGGNWSTASNWSTGTVPTASNDVVIDANGTYQVTLDVTPAFNTLTIGGGTTGTQTLADTTTRDIAFANPGTITSSGALTLSSGRLLGPAVLTVNGALNWNGDSEIQNTVAIASGASMNLSGVGTRYVNGGTINNSGTINWSGTDNISVYSGGVINNLSGGLFLATNDQEIYQHCCTSGQAFNNAGTIRKTTTTGSTTILSNGFNNTGTVDIQSGTFVPNSGGTSSGTFNATATGAFLFNNSTYNLTTGATLTGSGNFQIAAGQLNVSASGISVDHITMTGGNLNITATGAVTTSATGVIDWTADATLSGAGPLTVSSGGTLNFGGTGTRYIAGGTLNNNGTINWSGTNNLSVYDSGVINNLGTGIFSVTSDQIIYQHCCSPGQAFNNAGTFRKTVATGTTTILNNGFNNSGTVDIQSGTFNPSSGGTSTAVFQATAAGTFLFSSNTYTLATGATLTGSGNFQINSGQLTVNATGVTVDHMTINGGTLNVGGSLSTASTGVIDWIADATLTGAGALTISNGGTLNVSGAGTRHIAAGTLTNNGTVNWSGTNNISVVDSGVINNQAGGLFSVKNDQLIYQDCCSAGLAFNNAGTFRKSVATGQTTIQSNGFTNTSTGTVDIQTGTFNPSSGGTSTGIFNAASGATVLFNNNTYTLGAGATLTGSGNFQVSGGTLAVNATGVTVDHLTMNGGTMNVAGSISTSPTGVVDWSADAVLAGTGALTIVSGGMMNITGVGTRMIGGGTLNNSGTVNWSGTNNISVYDSGIINNQSGGLFSVKNDQIIYQHCCTAGQAFNNVGTFRKSVTTGTTTIQSNGFNNAGTVDIQSGTFTPSSGGTSSAVFNAASGGTFLFSGASTYTLNSGATLTGSGNFQVGGGTLTVNATGVTVDHLTMTGGTLNVAGSMSTTGSGVVDWTADAVLAGAGALTVASGATMNLSGAGTRNIDGGTLSNSGTINWSGTDNISIYNAGIINNLSGGLFSVTNDQLIYQSCCAAGQGVNNAGTFRKTTATGTTTIQSFANNSGTIQPQSGTIAFNSVFSNSGSPTYDFGIGSASSFGRLTFTNPVALTGALIAAPVNSFVPQGGQQFQIVIYPLTSTATFSPKTLTYGSSPVRSFADAYITSGVILTASGPTVNSSLSPNQGPGSGGTAVTITGTGFVSGGSLAVTFGGNAAAAVTVVNSTTITCTTPAHASGVVDVVVTNGDGQPTTVTNGFTYDTSPIVTAIRPGSASTAGSGGVIIDGTNLASVTSVDFGGASGTIVFSSAGQLTVAAPAHSAGVVNVVVTNNVGSYTMTNAFTYIDNDDPARDFFVSSLPSPRWTYGYEASRGAAFVPYPTHGRTGAMFDFWDNGSFPNLGRNSGSSTLTQGSDFTPSMALYFHPGPTGENSVFRWTAPASGVYRIHGNFTGLDNTWPTTSDVAILHNNVGGTPLFSAFINAYNVPQSFDVSPTLSSGDTIEFTVGWGQNNTNTGDATGLDVTIDPVAPTTADVAIVTTASVPSITAGASFSYFTTVTNNGPSPSSNTTMTLFLPANVTVTGIPSSTQGTCGGSGTIVCTIGILPANGTATQTINVSTTAAGTATANGSVTATETDPSNTNNSSSASVNVTSSSLAVTTNADSGVGSLRQAIINANNSAVCPSPCTISFNLPGGQLTILPTSSLPAISAANVTIDATTQPGYASAPLVTLDGTNIASVSSGLQLSGGNDAVKGLSIVSYQGPAIAIDTNGNDIISANYLGLRVNGTSAGQNAGDGVLVTTANNTIGSTITAARNVISGNFGSGVVLKGTSATGNVVAGNYIGTNAAGSAAVANQTDGVQILFAASNNTIGGATINTRNVISGNNNAGIYIAGDNSGPLVCSGNVVAGNYIGTDATGTTPLGNSAGLYLGNQVSNSTIGGLSAAAGNTISSITKGISLDGPGNGNVILHNTFSDNSSLSIDLANNGTTPNDAGDSDIGANGLQNTPVFVDATLAGSTLTAHVNADSSAVGGTNGMRIELFKSDAAGTHALQSLATQCFAGNTLSGATITIASAPVVVGDKLVATATSYVEASCITPSDGTSELTATPATVAACTPPAATITPSGPTTFCAGGSVTLTASPGASYQWRSFGTPIIGANAQTFVATNSGSYSVTVSDATGCSATSSNVPVTVNTTVTVTISAGGPTTFCAGGNVTLTANPSGGSGSFTSYQWLLNGSPIGGANGVAYSATATGNYSVTVADSAGCTATSAQQSVTVNTPPSAGITAPASVCPNSSVGASITTPAGGATYTWSVTNGTIQTGQGTSSISFSVGTASPVSISVTATINSCSSTGNASLTVGTFTPTITPSGSASFCAGGSVTLTSSAASSYQWLLNGSPIGSATSQTYAAPTAGSYTVTATNASGCIGTSAPVTVTQNASPSPTVTPGGPTTFCNGGSVTLSTGVASSYQWLFNGSPISGANGASYSASLTGNYSVTVTNGSGCSGTSSSVAVTVNPNPVVNITGPSSTCASSNVTLDAGAGFASYNWSNGALTQTITVTPSSTTTYNVNVTNAAGCTASASKTVTVSSGATTTTVTAPSSVASNSPNNSASVPAAAPGSTYSWSMTGGTITDGGGTPSITWTAGPSGNAVISIVITSGSCTASGSATIPISDVADLALSAAASPNPVSAGGTVTITLNVINNGPNAALNARITNNLFGVTAPTSSGNGWSCTTSNLTIVCSTATLALGPAAPLTITATASGTNTAGDDASVLADTADSNGNNNNASAWVGIIAAQPACNDNAPSLISPAAGAANVANPVTFTWSSTANAISYDLWIATGGAAPAIAATTQSTTTLLSLPSGPSTWYVAAHFAGDCPTLFSAPRDFTVAASTNCVHDAPQLIAPSPNAVVNSPVTFNWTAVAQAVGYRVWVAIDGSASQDVGTTNGATSLTVALSGSSIAWHVDAIFPGCNPTSSATSAFTIAAADACGNHAAPSLVAPANGATLASSIVDLQWNAVANANGYRVWAAINGAALAPIGTTTNSTTLHATFSSGVITWFVEALFNGCASSPSPQATFTIPAAQSCNNAAPTPLAPSNDATLGNSEIDFSWSSVPNAIGYELWLALNNGTPSPAGTTTATTLRRTVGAGVVDWFVRAQFNGCEPAESAHAHFTFAPPADCALVRPILTAPVDGAPIVFSPVDLRWSNVPGATQYKVWLGNGDAPPVSIGTTSATHLDNQSVPPGSVKWFVEALFDHCPTLQSTISTFTAAPAPPPCATPAVPLPRAESTASTNVEYVFRWTPAGPKATTQYELQESTDAAFSAPLSITTDASEYAFKHINSTDAPIAYFYRVRAVGTCNGARSLFSLPLTVQVLPSNVTDPNSANGSTPADNPQTTHYEIHIGGASNGNTAGNATHKGAIIAAAGDSFTATTNQPWLTVSPSSGTVGANGTTLNVTANTDGLPVGTSSGAVSVAIGTASGAGNRATLDTKPATNTTVSVNLVQPVSPIAKSGPPPDALIIPAVAHADGINSKFQSDIRVTNSSAQPMKYQVTFVPTGDAGITQGKQTTVDIGPGRTIALDDVLQSWFGDSAATGTLEVRPLTTAPASSTTTALPAGLANILTFASSRTYNTTANGTFGQYIPAIPFAAFVGRGSDPTKSTVLSLQQIAQSAAFRTNLGIVEGSGDPASVLISVFGSNGQKLTEFTQDLKGGQHVQLNSILATKNLQVTDGRIEVKVVSPGGKVTAYASVLDNLTNDPLLVSPVAVNQTAAAKYVIPGVADLNNGFANWQTDVRVFNPSTSIVKATLTFYSQSGGTPQSKDIQLAPGQVQTLDATLHNVFGISNDGGALHIATTAPTPLVATARTYNQTANGTYGQFIPAVTANDAAALGTRPLQILQIEESDRYRTNVGFAEVTGNAATVEVTAIPSDSKVAASTQIQLTPNQYIQFPQLLKSMGLTNNYNARVSVKVISGQGRVTAYASVIDMQTNDPTYVPAQ